MAGTGHTFARMTVPRLKAELAVCGAAVGRGRGWDRVGRNAYQVQQLSPASGASEGGAFAERDRRRGFRRERRSERVGVILGVFTEKVSKRQVGMSLEIVERQLASIAAQVATAMAMGRS